MPSQKRLLRTVFAGMGWRAPELLAAADADPEFHLDTVSQVHMDAWTTGRVALVGDAGYCGSPLTGMGTSLALVGAYVLAGELAREVALDAAPASDGARASDRGPASDGGGVDHTAAVRCYEEIMRPLVTAAHTLPPGGADGFLPRSRFMLRMRVLTARFMHHWPMKQLVARMLDRSEAIELPRYDAPVANAR
ncbi:hypothetical protein [Microbacterium lacticum]|uniref:hypothetical protein n=1 Tax=Microbacterium lacticum TaxID=33885 RepID=UPI0028D0C3A7|nr:hypothetical protein [Microbacterium lacticum]